MLRPATGFRVDVLLYRAGYRLALPGPGELVLPRQLSRASVHIDFLFEVLVVTWVFNIVMARVCEVTAGYPSCGHAAHSVLSAKAFRWSFL